MDNFDNIVDMMVGKYITKYGVYEQYDDLIGVANLAVVEGLNTFNPEIKDDLENWIKLYVKNRLNNYIQRKVLKHKLDIVNSKFVGAVVGKMEDVVSIVEQFNLLERTIIYLAFVEKVSYVDIASVLDISVYKVRAIAQNLKRYFIKHYQ